MPEQIDQVESLVQRTIETGQGNSIVVQTLDQPKFNFACRQVVLNGLVHFNHQLAVNELVKQLDLPFSQFELVLDLLRQKNTNPIVFILYEMHLFCNHNRQLLLYNLFDIAQAGGPIVVVGVTSMIDFIDLFEKRVKSRFSHNTVPIYPKTSKEYFISLAKFLMEPTGDLIGNQSYLDSLETLEGKVFGNIVNQIIMLNASESLLRKVLARAVNQMDNDYVTPELLLLAWAMENRDYRSDLVQGFSVLQLMLLIAVKHKMAQGELEFNFEIIYQEYLMFAKRHANMGHGSSLFFAKEAAMRAFELLLQIRILIPVSAVSASKEYKMVFWFNSVSVERVQRPDK